MNSFFKNRLFLSFITLLIFVSIITVMAGSGNAPQGDQAGHQNNTFPLEREIRHDGYRVNIPVSTNTAYIIEPISGAIDHRITEKHYTWNADCHEKDCVTVVVGDTTKQWPKSPTGTNCFPSPIEAFNAWTGTYVVVNSGSATNMEIFFDDIAYSDNAGSCRVKVSVLKLNLDIWNGGSDLDNGENQGPQGDPVPDADEETIGAYLLVNWDDDDGDGEINATGSGWKSLPKPDLDESTSITNEDNLVQLRPYLEPMLNTGTIEFEVSGADKDKIKLWTTSTKGTEVALTSNKKTWDLSNLTQKSEFQNFMANSLWIEGIDEGSAERAIIFTLRYKDSGGAEICNDVNKATIVLIKIGSALYREMAGWPENRGHAGLLTAFNGECKASDLVDSSKYQVTEMQRSPNDCVSTTWKAFHAASSAYWGQYDCSQSYVNRLKVLLVAKYIFNDTGGNIEYCLTDVLEPNAWDGNLSDVESLRCDGLPELCYEWTGLQVWGKIVSGSAHYSIITYTDEHNEFVGDWQKHLFPATQCGWESTYKGVNWNTQFIFSDVVRPLGAITW